MQCDVDHSSPEKVDLNKNLNKVLQLLCNPSYIFPGISSLYYARNSLPSPAHSKKITLHLNHSAAL
jgi:hypothetical protein